jgi:hypothetical protein
VKSEPPPDLYSALKRPCEFRPCRAFLFFMTYSEKLQHPNWQRKRLRILERDDFTCQICQSTDKTLHVHHHYYKAVTDPWDYPDEALISYCLDCHEDQTAMMQDIKQMIYQICAANNSCYDLYKRLQTMVIELKRQDKFIPQNF